MYEISARLAVEGTPLNRTSVGQILSEEGFGRLLRRPEPEAEPCRPRTYRAGRWSPTALYLDGDGQPSTYAASSGSAAPATRRTLPVRLRRCHAASATAPHRVASRQTCRRRPCCQLHGLSLVPVCGLSSVPGSAGGYGCRSFHRPGRPGRHSPSAAARRTRRAIASWAGRCATRAGARCQGFVAADARTTPTDRREPHPAARACHSPT